MQFYIKNYIILKHQTLILQLSSILKTAKYGLCHNGFKCYRKKNVKKNVKKLFNSKIMPTFELVFHGFRFLGLNNKGWSSILPKIVSSFLICL